MEPSKYMKIIVERGKVHELDAMIENHFSSDGPVHYAAILTEEQVQNSNTKRSWDDA